ncbi:RxLR effector protein [Phytophthora megakarya]|uniref:RxLR effector protein n=1 Tax=Phytophthora megakarya TaxID=4795 RepID=A0A225VG21_9STRA|nr:RxLR effector protein [Phytophthora megakarya]
MKIFSILVMVLLVEMALSATTPRHSITPPETMRRATETSANRFLRADVSPKGFNALGVNSQVMDEERGLSSISKKLKERLQRIVTHYDTPIFIQEFGNVLASILRHMN